VAFDWKLRINVPWSIGGSMMQWSAGRVNYALRSLVRSRESEQRQMRFLWPTGSPLCLCACVMTLENCLESLLNWSNATVCLGLSTLVINYVADCEQCAEPRQGFASPLHPFTDSTKRSQTLKLVACQTTFSPLWRNEKWDFSYCPLVFLESLWKFALCAHLQKMTCLFPARCQSIKLIMSF